MDTQDTSQKIEISESDFQAAKFLADRGLSDKDRPITEGDLAALDTWIAHRSGRKTASEKYREALERHEHMKRSPQFADLWKRQNDDFKAFMQRDVSPIAGSVFTSPTVSALSIQYANEEYIGESLVNTVNVAKQTGLYFIYPQRERLQYPDDQMGSRGKANEIHETRTQGTYACTPFGYSDWISALALANQDAPLDEMVDLTQSLAEGLAFRRERRIRTALTTAGNYGANTFAVAAASAWNSAGGGNPILDLQRADAMLWQGRGPGRKLAFTSLGVYNVLSRHPSILQLFVFNGSSPGLATPDMLAKFFSWDGLKVGRAREDTAAEGVAAAYARIWEPAGAFFFGIVRVAEGGIRNAGFATVFRQGQPQSTTIYDPLSGHGGGYVSQLSVCESQPTVVAAATGALITTPIV